MNKMIERCKENPKQLISTSAIIGLVIAVITLVYQFDDRYALRKDVLVIQKQNTQVIEMLNSYKTTRITLLRLKIATGEAAAEDKVELEILERL